jgi:hypothetical protein
VSTLIAIASSATPTPIPVIAAIATAGPMPAPDRLRRLDPVLIGATYVPTSGAQPD